MKSGKWATKANFDKDEDCSGVYITSKSISLQGMTPIPNRAVLKIQKKPTLRFLQWRLLVLSSN